MLLSDEERKKFAEYLRREAATNKLLMEQADKIGMPDVTKERLRQRIAAQLIVASDLESCESFTV